MRKSGVQLKMQRANTLVRLSPALNNCLTRNSIFYKAPICASLLLQSRSTGSHGPPAHWKTLKQISLETKSHMDFLPVPEGSWQESYSKKQKKANLLLAASALAFGLTYYIVYKSGCIYLHGYDYKTFKTSAGLSGPGVVASFSSEAASKKECDTSKTSPPAPAQADSGESNVSPGGNPQVDDLSKIPDIPDHVQYLIIGAGTAAFGAFRAIKSRDPRAKILVVGDEDSVPYMRPPLSKELWFNDDKEEVESLQFKQWNGKKRSIFYEPKEFFAEPKQLNSLENGGIALLMGKKVVKLDAGKKTAWLASGEKIKYEKCLIATGGKPRNLPVLAKAAPEVKSRTVLFRNVNMYLVK